MGTIGQVFFEELMEPCAALAAKACIMIPRLRLLQQGC
jgi:hypothetical protein